MREARFAALRAKYKIGPSVISEAIFKALRKIGRSFGIGGVFFLRLKKIGKARVIEKARKIQKSSQ